MASFGPIAPHYDILMSKVPYPMWVDYYGLLLAKQGLTPDRLLDVCCGTGTVAEMLTAKGFHVTGFDLSEPMIVEARRKEVGIEYHVADARDFHLGKTFEAAYSFFDSLNYIAEADGFRKAIFCIAEHVEPGGSLIFDLNTAYAFEAKMFDQQNQKKGAPIRYRWRGEFDPETLLVKVSMDFVRDGVEFQEVHVQRAHPHDEVIQNLEDAGFGNIWTYESYTLDRPRKRSDRLHYAAIRLG